MNTEATRDLVQRFQDARLTNDKDAIAALLTEDVEMHTPASMGWPPIVGREAVSTALSGGSAGKYLDVATIKRDLRKIIADGDTAAALQTVSATSLKGADYKNEYIWVYTCKDGKIARLDENADSLFAARVFGWVTETADFPK